MSRTDKYGIRYPYAVEFEEVDNKYKLKLQVNYEIIQKNKRDAKGGKGGGGRGGGGRGRGKGSQEW